MWWTTKHQAPSTKHQGSVEVVTIHGTLKTDHPLLIDILTKDPALERLKGIRQYGICDSIESPLGIPVASIGYSRFHHSLGCMLGIAWYHDKEGEELLKAMVCAVEHDASHLPNSHSLDRLLRELGFLDVSHQDITLHAFLKKHGVEELLAKYNVSIEEILPDKHPIQEQKSGVYNDRVDYVRYAAYMEKQFDPAELNEISNLLHFANAGWYFDGIEAAIKFAKIPLWNSRHRWGGPDSFVTSTCLGHAVIKLFELGKITAQELDFKLNDKTLWQRLVNANDPYINNRLDQIKHPANHFKVITEEEFNHTTPH